MKTCSYCGKENQDTLNYCEDCGLALSHGETSERSAPDDTKPLVVLATFGDSVEANILKGRLEQVGIEACIPEELDPSPFGNFPPLSHVTVRVTERDLPAAREVLADSPELIQLADSFWNR